MNPVRAADDPEIGRRLLNIRELERRTTLAVNNAGDIQLPLERDPRVIRWVREAVGLRKVAAPVRTNFSPKGSALVGGPFVRASPDQIRERGVLRRSRRKPVSCASGTAAPCAASPG